MSGNLYRDMAGRIRTDSYFASGRRFSVLEDWAAVETPASSSKQWLHCPVVVLDPIGQTATSLEGISRIAHGWFYTHAACTAKSGEFKVLFGIRCQRVEFRARDGSDEGHSWISEAYGLVVSDLEVKGEWTKTWETLSLELSEPASEVFEVPAKFANLTE